MKFLFFVALFQLQTACSAPIMQLDSHPSREKDKRVFVVHNNWHAALVVRKADLSQGVVPEQDDFPDAESFDPGRYVDPREEDLANRWTWVPFGAGRHRCVGANFAMIQLKAIFSVLLQDWEFELAQPAGTYRNDHSKMVVQLAQPCAIRYRKRRR